MPTHGTYYSYVNGCRCDECKSANRAQAFKDRHRRKGQEPKNHGYSGYTNWGCRCEICTKANTDYGREYQRKQRAEFRRLKEASGDPAE